MKSILVLFQSISTYLSIIVLFIPFIPACIAWKKGVRLSSEMKLFFFLLVVALVIQYLITTLVWFCYFTNQYWDLYNFLAYWLFRLFSIFEVVVYLYLFLKWAELSKYFIHFFVIAVLSLILVDYYSNTSYPDLLSWLSSLIILFVCFVLSYMIDTHSIKIKKEYNYILIGTYLYCIISLIGITPNNSELRSLGHILHSIAIIVSYIYYYKGFRCLYQ